METVLFEIEMMISNGPLTYIYPTSFEACLTPNHLLSGRILNHVSDHNTSIIYRSIDLSAYSNSVNEIINHFWGRWKKEYVVNLQKKHTLMKSNHN